MAAQNIDPQLAAPPLEEGYAEDDLQQNEDSGNTWDSLPIFATDSHKQLFEKIKSEKKRLEKLTQEAAENTERVSIMSEHLKNVKQELLHTQALCDSKIRESETEQHLKSLADREAGRIQVEVSKGERDLQTMQDKLSSLQNDTYRANERLEQFKQQMNYDQEALEQWALAAKQKDEDSLALAKYMRADEERIKSLNLHIEKLNKEFLSSERQLEEEVTETQTAQIELDRTAEDFKKLHLERQALIKQWDEAVKAMARRDQTITQLAEKISIAKREVSDLETVLVQQREFLEREQANNKQLTVQIAGDERKVEKARQAVMTAQGEVRTLDEAVETQRSDLHSVSNLLAISQAHVSSLRQSKADKEVQLEQMKQKLDVVKQRLEEEYQKSSTLEERSAQVDAYYKEHEEALKSVEREIEVMKENMFKHSQELFKLRKEEANLVADISGTQSTARNLQAKIHDLDQKSLKQQEMLYTIEFQVQQLERKVARASGKRSQEETVILNKRIAELQTELDAATEQFNMLTSQLKRLNDDIRATKRQLVTATQEKEILEGRIAELNLQNETAQSQLKGVTKQKEEYVVQHDVLSLEVKRLRDLLHAKADQVIGLENRKAQLQLSMEERLKDIDVHREVQRLELKTADEEKHKIAMELNERLLKVDKLKQKFRTIAGRLQGIDAEEHSQAYYIIQAAQERDALQKEGDELNEAIKVAEKEIRLLTRTLASLNVRNENYRNSFHKVDVESEELKEQHELEEQLRATKSALIKKRSYLREIATDFEERRRALGEVQGHIQSLRVEVEQAGREHDQLDRAVSEQRDKIERAQLAAHQRQTQLRRAKKAAPDQETLEETDIRLQELNHKNKALLNFLLHFVEGNPHLEHTVHDAMDAVGLRFPSRPPSVSSRASSVASLRDFGDPVAHQRGPQRTAVSMGHAQFGSGSGSGSGSAMVSGDMMAMASSASASAATSSSFSSSSSRPGSRAPSSRSTQ